MSSRPQVELAFVSPHLRAWAGLERVGDETTGEVVFFGQLEAFEESDLVPPGTPFPGQTPGGRGVRWKDAADRRHVWTKWTAKRLRLKVFPTALERKRNEEQCRVRKELAKVERELAALDEPSEKFRRELSRIMCATGIATKQMMLSEDGAWRYSQEAADQFEELVAQMHELLHESPLKRNEPALEAVKRKRAALTDDKFRKSMLKVVTGGVS